MIILDAPAVRTALFALLKQVNQPSDDAEVKKWAEYVRTAVRHNNVYFFSQETYMTLRSAIFSPSLGADLTGMRLPSPETIYVELSKTGAPRAIVVAVEEGTLIRGVGLTVIANEIVDNLPAHVKGGVPELMLAYVRNVISMCEFISRQPTVHLCMPSLL